jgi:hypothetical protein
MENKLEKYYDLVSDSLLNGTKHWSKDTDSTHIVGVIYPMYYSDYGDIEFYYTKEEIKEWLHRKWLTGRDDMKYLNDVYGLTEEESSIVMNKYKKKLVTILLSKYGR